MAERNAKRDTAKAIFIERKSNGGDAKLRTIAEEVERLLAMFASGKKKMNGKLLSRKGKQERNQETKTARATGMRPGTITARQKEIRMPRRTALTQRYFLTCFLTLKKR